MSLWAILGSGQSLTQQDADYLRGKCRVMAISDSFKMAPWADAMTSHDTKWWHAHPEALDFAGEKFCRFPWAGTRDIKPEGYKGACNSGLFGMLIAASHYAASAILLLGFDMRGTHFFGPHEKLPNTSENKFEFHKRQFLSWRGPPVTNCTPGSALKCFPMADLRSVI